MTPGGPPPPAPTRLARFGQVGRGARPTAHPAATPPPAPRQTDERLPRFGRRPGGGTTPSAQADAPSVPAHLSPAPPPDVQVAPTPQRVIARRPVPRSPGTDQDAVAARPVMPDGEPPTLVAGRAPRLPRFGAAARPADGKRSAPRRVAAPPTPPQPAPARGARLPRFASRALVRPGVRNVRRLRRSAAAVIALLVAFGLPRLARSILPDPLPLARPVTIQPRAQDGPQGMRVGAATLNAQAELGAGFDSNLFAQSRARAIGDGFRTEAVRARLDTNWRRDALYAEAALDDRGYVSRTANNTTDAIAGLGGRWDAARDVAVEGAYRHTRAHLSVSDPASQLLGALRPVPFDRDEARLSATWRPGDLTLKAEAGATSVRFGGAGGVSLAANDRDQAGLGLAAAWTFAPGNAVTAAVSGDAIRYDRNVSRRFDGAAFQAVAGVSWTSDALWRARLSLGYLRRDFDGAGLKPLEGVAVDGALTWIPARETAVTLAIRRGLDEVLSADPVPAIRQVISLAVQHEATRDLTVQAALRLDRRELSQPRRVAEDGVVALGAEWRFTRNLALLGTYEHAVRLVGFAGLPNYNRDLVAVRLRTSL